MKRTAADGDEDEDDGQGGNVIADGDEDEEEIGLAVSIVAPCDSAAISSNSRAERRSTNIKVRGVRGLVQARCNVELDVPAAILLVSALSAFLTKLLGGAATSRLLEEKMRPMLSAGEGETVQGHVKVQSLTITIESLFQSAKVSEFLCQLIARMRMLPSKPINMHLYAYIHACTCDLFASPTSATASRH